jgi:hypothetical protein
MVIMQDTGAEGQTTRPRARPSTKTRAVAAGPCFFARHHGKNTQYTKHGAHFHNRAGLVWSHDIKPPEETLGSAIGHRKLSSQACSPRPFIRQTLTLHRPHEKDRTADGAFRVAPPMGYLRISLSPRRSSSKKKRILPFHAFRIAIDGIQFATIPPLPSPKSQQPWPSIRRSRSLDTLNHHICL